MARLPRLVRYPRRLQEQTRVTRHWVTAGQECCTGDKPVLATRPSGCGVFQRLLFVCLGNGLDISGEEKKETTPPLSILESSQVRLVCLRQRSAQRILNTPLEWQSVLALTAVPAALSVFQTDLKSARELVAFIRCLFHVFYKRSWCPIILSQEP
ncbi:hypothetical protein NDU88_004878 [Pleurodeles waltl]|uniref:Uncharacterized protein n=1 Tax=Pleurodeles waltl TaxID=8319 RepID=A0AAV7W9F7_PLEWA|nr:hypothetical protein NDU88_004878 [Pleurodeles waltl]